MAVGIRPSSVETNGNDELITSCAGRQLERKCVPERFSLGIGKVGALVLDNSYIPLEESSVIMSEK
jgi:hypothetical protein